MKKRRSSKYRMTHIETLIYNLEKITKSELMTDQDKESARSLITWHLRHKTLTDKQLRYADVMVFRMKGKEKAAKERQTPEKFWLYAIRSDDAVKLGVSNNPSKRLKTLQTSHNKKLRVVWRYYVGNDRKEATKLEKKLHRFCNEHHQRGEWFDLFALNLLCDFRP